MYIYMLFIYYVTNVEYTYMLDLIYIYIHYIYIYICIYNKYVIVI